MSSVLIAKPAVSFSLRAPLAVKLVGANALVVAVLLTGWWVAGGHVNWAVRIAVIKMLTLKARLQVALYLWRQERQPG